jgi:hypothetical protein
MLTKLRFRFWLAIATAPILLIGDRQQQEDYNGWLEERLTPDTIGTGRKLKRFFAPLGEMDE